MTIRSKLMYIVSLRARGSDEDFSILLLTSYTFSLLDIFGLVMKCLVKNQEAVSASFMALFSILFELNVWFTHSQPT